MTESTITPELSKQISEAVYEAGERARAESQMVMSQAQRIFYEYWNAGVHKETIENCIAQFEKCVKMADEIRQVASKDFEARVSKYDKEIRDKASKSNIILPDSRMWKDWRVGG